MAAWHEEPGAFKETLAVGETAVSGAAASCFGEPERAGVSLNVFRLLAEAARQGLTAFGSLGTRAASSNSRVQPTAKARS